MIIDSLDRLKRYEYNILPMSLVQNLEKYGSEVKARSIKTLTRMLECYCHITKIEFSYTTLSSKKLRTILQGFVGAISSENFVTCKDSSRKRFIDTLTKTFVALRKNTPEMPDPIEATSDLEFCLELWRKQSADNYQALDQSAIKYWRGWKVVCSGGSHHYMALNNLWHSHGEAFTQQFYEGWKDLGGKQRRITPTQINRLADFISKNKELWPAAAFRDPVQVRMLFLTHMSEFLRQGSTNKNKMLPQVWNIFMAQIQSAYIAPGIWAAPSSSLPRVLSEGNVLTGTKTKEMTEGDYIQDQLLTEVPLHITDDEAIEIIFKRLRTDIQTVKSWAAHQAHDLYRRAERRKVLAIEGKVRLNSFETSVYPTSLADLCATFEHHGLVEEDNVFWKIYGRKNKRENLAFNLGIPTHSTLFPYQCLLVAEHPKITPNFLHGFKLYNEKGEIVGFLPTDTGHQIVGYKDRRGPALSEMKIDLTPRSAKWIQEIIEITAPLREFLRARNDDRWRLLFLTTGKAFKNPSPALCKNSPSILKAHPSVLARISEQLEPFTDLRRDELLKFIPRICLSRLRASCGVAIYLETHDVKKMAEALGHVRHSASLLAHYLPESILAFFQSRWIRLFQRGMICLAMKDSPYLLEAADFADMNELHTFLKNHAIREIPAHLEDPERIGTSDSKTTSEVSQVLIQIESGVLTALLSLEDAVNEAPEPQKVSGKAHYWAEFTRLLISEIERDNDGLLHKHLTTARMHANASRMESLIYDAA